MQPLPGGVQERGRRPAGGAVSQGAPQAQPGSGGLVLLRVLQRSHAQLVGERNVVVCLTVAWSLPRNPGKSDTGISVIEDQLSSKETQEP